MQVTPVALAAELKAQPTMVLLPLIIWSIPRNWQGEEDPLLTLKGVKEIGDSFQKTMYVMINDSTDGDELRLIDVVIVPVTELKLTPVKDIV